MTKVSHPNTKGKHAVRWLFLAAVALAVAGGALLSLPACWDGPYPVQPDHPLTRYQFVDHALDCLFTSAAATTGTSLSVFDAGYDLSRTGQIVLVVLMEIGGLAVLVLGSVVGWRLRQMIGWGAAGEDASHTGVRRLVVFVCIAAVAIQAAGTALLLVSSDIVPGGVEAARQDRLLAGVFHAVSAFCNCGLTLSRDSLLPHRDTVTPYAILLPLMLLGGIGGPVLYEVWRRLKRASNDAPRRVMSTDSKITLLVTLGLIVVGTGLLFGIESTTRWQLRYPRDDTPGRIGLPSTGTAAGEIVFSAEGSPRAQSERLRTMTPARRLAAALFQSIAARTCGMSTARLDESSLSPASRVVLMAWMLIGGALGGTTGGLRIIIIVLLLRACPKTLQIDRLEACPTPVLGQALTTITRRKPNEEPRAEAVATVSEARAADRARMILAATSVAVSMLVLIGATTLVVVYRQAASLEASLFEAISAACNVGFSTGLTRQLAQLAVEDRLAGQLALLVAMLLGKVLPLGILLRCTRPHK